MVSLTVTTTAPATAASPVVVGLVGPSGVQATVPQLAGHVQAGFARTGAGLTDTTGHDTGVAGIIVDLAPTATIVPVVRDWCDGLDKVVSLGAEVVVIPMISTQDIPCLRTSVAKAVAADVVVVGGVGNDGQERTAPIYPADYPGVIGAGAVDASDWRPSWANVGPSVDLVAPGDNVRILTRDGGATSASGTSYSAAYIAGVAADLRAENPGWTAARTVAHLTTTARDLGAPGRDWWFGDGLVTR